jgi:hypothetical protein
MRSFKWLMLIVVSMTFVGCAGQFKKYDENALFSIELPSGMVDLQGLNNDAALQYGYPIDTIAENEGAKEQYIIVMLETKEEIASYGLDTDFDALKYSQVSMEALQYNLEDFEIVSGETQIEERNGMQFVEMDMQGSVGELSVFYKLAVYEGNNAFYQILAWCNLEDKDQFLPDMNKSIASFKEK